MKKKKIVYYFLSFVLILGMLTYTNSKETYAMSSNDVSEKLNTLINQYNWKTASSNVMYMGSQCKGFANWVFLQVFGVYIGPYSDSANI